jgi:hypothetical protein
MYKYLLIIPLLTGCVETTVTDGKFKFTTKRLLWQGNIQQATFTTATNGIINAEIKGYGSQSAELIEAASRGAAQGLLNSISK